MRARTISVGGLLVLGGLLLAAILIAVLALQVLDKSSGTIVSSAEKRQYLLYVPPSYDGTREVPLVISLHAAAMWPAQQSNLSRWNRLADEHGFIVVYPSGRGIPKIWPDGLVAGQMHDVQFIADLVDAVSAKYNVDAARIYLNGMSNGGGMANIASCVLADRIAAVGLVAAVQIVPSSACTPVRPVPLIAFHGDADRMAPYAGGPLGDPFNPAKPIVPGVRDWVTELARRNQCSDDVAESSPAADVSRLEYRECADGADVVLYTIHGGGHTWPGGKLLPRWLAGSTTATISATHEMWEFFVKHRLHAR